MKNFQLNNTSVYLSGQCKWDIVISTYQNELYISGFQLSPISHNIPFNKKGDVDTLNDNHSYTLKTFYETIKENFWNGTPCLDNKYEYKDDKNNIIGYYDNSFFAGLKRAKTYKVYHKQFEYFQPLWLEKVDPNQYLKFDFITFSPTGNQLNKHSLSLNKKEGDIFEFHNQFVEYFNKWLEYIGIKGEEGNDRVMYVNMNNNIAQIQGVSVLSGQNSGLISCDYLVNNLLSYERPNIETDYILTTLFQNHNTVLSQLINFNFCFNSNDVIDPFMNNQLLGGKVSIKCNVGVVKNNTYEAFAKKSLFSNYEFIQKELFDPFVFMSDAKGLDDISTDEIKFDYTKKYNKNNNKDGEVKVEEINVLDYLRDYENKYIKDVNKLTQHIIHWGYSDVDPNTFNLYNGYDLINTSKLSVDDLSIKRTEENNTVTYEESIYEINRLNNLCIPIVNSVYNNNNGALNWISPTNILYFGYTDKNGDHEDFDDTIVKIGNFIKKYVYYTSIREKYTWDINNSILNNYVKSDDNSDNRENIQKYLFVYIDNKLTSNDLINLKFTIGSSSQNIFSFDGSYGDEDEFLQIYKDHGNTYILVTNKLNYFSIKTLSELNNPIPNINDSINIINKTILAYNNDYDFYGFGTEIVIGRDELGDDVYYKSNFKKTFIYRRNGKLSPFLTGEDSNYQYYKSYGDNIITRYSENEFYESYDFEKGKVMLLYQTLNFNINKSSSNPKTVKELIKDELKKVYDISGDDDKSKDLVDYIYNMYDVNFTYEYESLENVDNIIYTIKLELR